MLWKICVAVLASGVAIGDGMTYSCIGAIYYRSACMSTQADLAESAN